MNLAVKNKIIKLPDPILTFFNYGDFFLPNPFPLPSQNIKKYLRSITTNYPIQTRLIL